MRRAELHVEHYHNKRFLSSRRFLSRGKSIVFGSATTADLRLLGESVNGVHAIVEHTEQGWMLYDMTPPTPQGQTGHERAITQPTTLDIGAHQLRLVPKELSYKLFEPSVALAPKLSDHFIHQIVVKQNGHVVHTYNLKANETFHYSVGTNNVQLAPPPQGQPWKTTELGTFLFLQRLTPGPDAQMAAAAVTFDRNDKIAMIAAMSFIAVVIFAVIVASFSKKEVAKYEENDYSRMIFDAKVTEKKKQESVKMAKKMAPKKTTEQQPSNKVAAGAPRTLENAPSAKKVLTNIRAAQLGQIIGRISNRAAKSLNASMGVALGPKESTGAPVGSGMPSVGGLGQLGNGKLANSRYKIAAVGTSGKGGGVSDFKGVGGLKAGAIGNADVGLVEEEAEVDGGLDREVIAQYIKSQLGQIRYCYERQLSANPDLYGKVQVAFVIGGDGGVTTQNIGVSTLKSAMVEGCILRRVSNWKFPAPKGGTQVKVTYPFLFKSTN